jgi:hypothetical protein
MSSIPVGGNSQMRLRIIFASACLTALTALPVSTAAASKHGYYPYGWGWDVGPPWIRPYELSPSWEGPYETYEPSNGKIKLKHVDKQDNIFLDGSFIGTVGDVKTIKLRPGTHSLEIKHWGKDALWDKDVLKEQVSVIAGKTIKLNVGDKVR